MPVGGPKRFEGPADVRAVQSGRHVIIAGDISKIVVSEKAAVQDTGRGFLSINRANWESPAFNHVSALLVSTAPWFRVLCTLPNCFTALRNIANSLELHQAAITVEPEIVAVT